MTEERVVVSVLGGAAVTRVASHLARAGASVVTHEASASPRAILSGADALVLDVGDAPERLAALAAALDGDAAARTTPRAVVVAPSLSASRLRGWGCASVVLDDEPELGDTLGRLVERARLHAAVLRKTRELEAQLAAARRRLALLRDHGATLAHDTRVLFGVVLGFASNLRDGVSGPVEEAQQKQLASIVAAATDASALVDRHTSALRAALAESEREQHLALDDGREGTRRRLSDLGELVSDVARMFEGIAQGKGITLSVTTEPALAWCDAVQIKQAVVNLLTNALKLTPRGGTIALAAFAKAPRPEVEIVVSDTGPGIPLADRERVFERGVRLDRDEATPGSGLGLAVVRDVVRLHGGSVRLEEGVYGGAVFVLTLPTDRRSRSDHAPPSGRSV